ncbi:hypothetical protein [Polaromonas sp. UC242_47]|uniref:hypothetical protein n=1 Tax=Polaromonas sp. UC242_47 TaxID=3374626 RepID=UPI0037B10438
MYLIVIAWIYVVLMMSVAEATNTTGTLLGAIVTFVLYGLGPVALVVYLMRTPARRRAIKAREASEAAQAAALQSASKPPDSGQPDTSRHAAGGVEAVAVAVDTGVAPMRKES